MPTVSLSKVNMFYLEEGEGFPLVFITGLGGKAEYWKPDLKFYNKHFRCICVDNRGMGGTGLPEGDLRIRDMAEDVYEFLNIMKIDKAHILGLSMGGAIAQELVINHPEKVEKLILSSTWPKTNAYMARLFQAFIDLGKVDFGLFIDMMLLWGFNYTFYEKYLKDIKALEDDRKKTPFPFKTLKAHCEACIHHDTLSRLEKIKVPTLITVGEKDILTPPFFAGTLNEKIENSTLKTFKECGHLHLWEDPVGYRKEAIGFLNKI